jgi:hypothetical protein
MSNKDRQWDLQAKECPSPLRAAIEKMGLYRWVEKKDSVSYRSFFYF